MNEPIITTTLARIQTDPQGDAPVATAYFEQKTVIGDQTFVAPWKSASWPLQSAKTVTVDGVEYPYYLASQLVTAIAYQEYAEQSAPAAPAE